MTAPQLRKKHPRFAYKGFEYALTKDSLDIEFYFTLEPDIVFRPRVILNGVRNEYLQKIGDATLRNFIFHLGLAEMPSYWKCAVSPEIIVEAGPLTRRQEQWWQDLIFHGLGEFFYKNKIDFTKRRFLTIRAKTHSPFPLSEPRIKGGSFLVPVGGGKDSLVALELLKRAGQKFQPFILGNVPAAFAVVKAARCPEPVVLRREIDPKLLALNRNGYLNGHTPFSAYLAFASVFCAKLFGHHAAAVANERSANEETTIFHGKPINHQYSKSFDFEKKFRAYASRYLTKNVSYLSAMRPLYELQIAQIAASLKNLPAIKSCNVNQKKGTWCGKCSKCLTAFLLLYPFVDEHVLIRMFKRNLFANNALWRYIPALVGETAEKPFECVATRKETRAAFQLAIEKVQTAGRPLPVLLERYRRTLLPRYRMPRKAIQNMLRTWDRKNFLPKEMSSILRVMLRTSEKNI